MSKRSIWVGLLLLATFLAEGCCHRPFLFRRFWWGGCCEPGFHGPVVGSSYFGGGCCDPAGPVVIDAHAAPRMIVPPLAPSVPGATPGLNMPGATPLTKARFALSR